MLYSNMFGVVVSAILLSTVTDIQGRYVNYRYHEEFNGSVSHKKVIATWEDAKQRCEREGAVLASPINDGLLEYMKSSIGVNNHTTPYFIGIKATANPELIFVSMEGVLLDNLPDGAVDMIDQLDPSDGDCLSMDRHNIRVVTCRSRLPYLCYFANITTETTTEVTTQATTEATTEVTTSVTITEATTEVTTQSATAVPVTGYELHAGSFYKVHLENVHWDVAQSTCTAEGGYLAVINNEDEAKIVKNFAFSETDSNWITIGLRDYKSDGQWTSVHGDPLDQIFNKWATTRSKDRYCGSLKKNGDIDDQFCDASYPFICERLF